MPRRKNPLNQGYDYKQKYCSRACQHKAMNKGGFIHHSGYRIIHVNGKKIAEHRYVMEQVLGRTLRPDETIHHVNGQRTDNRRENLELWSSRQPKGQRVEDKVKWAIELIKTYPEVSEQLGYEIRSVYEKDADDKQPNVYQNQPDGLQRSVACSNMQVTVRSER